MKHNRPGAAAGLLAATALVLAGCGQSHASLSYANGSRVDCGGRQEIAASGSTAQANAMKQFVDAYSKTCKGQSLSYTANASAAGVADFLAGKTDFAGSDLPLSGDQYAAAKERCSGADVWNVPVVFGPIAITYNLNAVDSLVLDAPTLARIFNGSITRWDDPAITALNASMPPENIHVVYRAEASGTTAHFQAYLQAASGGTWDKGIGKGNDLVLDTASFYNPTQPDVYPIVMVTYEIVCSKYPNADVGQAVKAFLQAAVGPGQADLDKNGYIPLPPDFQSRAFGAVDAITSAPIANSG